MVLGPAEAPIALLRGRFRFRILVRAPRRANVQGSLREPSRRLRQREEACACRWISILRAFFKSPLRLRTGFQGARPPAMPWDLTAARERLKTVFGYDDFRPGQDEIVAAALAGQSVLAVMPTGSGKSMCFQLPAIVETRSPSWSRP